MNNIINQPRPEISKKEPLDINSIMSYDDVLKDLDQTTTIVYEDLEAQNAQSNAQQVQPMQNQQIQQLSQHPQQIHQLVQQSNMTTPQMNQMSSSPSHMNQMSSNPSQMNQMSSNPSQIQQHQQIQQEQIKQQQIQQQQIQQQQIQQQQIQQQQQQQMQQQQMQHHMSQLQNSKSSNNYEPPHLKTEKSFFTKDLINDVIIFIMANIIIKNRYIKSIINMKFPIIYEDSTIGVFVQSLVCVLIIYILKYMVHEYIEKKSI